MEGILVKRMGFSLMIYIAVMILFKENYYIYVYYINSFLLISFLLYILIKKENNMIYFCAIFITLALVSPFYSIDFSVISFKIFHLQNSFLNGILLGALVNYFLLWGLINTPFNIILPSHYMLKKDNFVFEEGEFNKFFNNLLRIEHFIEFSRNLKSK